MRSGPRRPRRRAIRSGRGCTRRAPGRPAGGRPCGARRAGRGSGGRRRSRRSGRTRPGRGRGRPPRPGRGRPSRRQRSAEIRARSWPTRAATSGSSPGLSTSSSSCHRVAWSGSATGYARGQAPARRPGRAGTRRRGRSSVRPVADDLGLALQHRYGGRVGRGGQIELRACGAGVRPGPSGGHARPPGRHADRGRVAGTADQSLSGRDPHVLAVGKAGLRAGVEAHAGAVRQLQLALGRLRRPHPLAGGDRFARATSAATACPLGRAGEHLARRQRHPRNGQRGGDRSGDRRANGRPASNSTATTNPGRHRPGQARPANQPRPNPAGRHAARRGERLRRHLARDPIRQCRRHRPAGRERPEQGGILDLHRLRRRPARRRTRPGGRPAPPPPRRPVRRRSGRI